jgi:hypothetical protein
MMWTRTKNPTSLLDGFGIELKCENNNHVNDARGK